ncbi:46439_t:CDS:2 [Gigaspora margarita]|uniref:46439_t:CDS:1 n=1 Tax=Gigaspora margarita TaxID=4874 RepID=A0ABN7UZH9_GIGMA|nr:46439_t:CDS:2 [Gigaspora margarita]
MPYYTNTEPDSFNLDTLLSKHGDKLRVVTCNKNAKNLKVLSNNFNPQQCTDKEGVFPGMEIDLNINIYNNLPKVEKSPYQPRYNITQPFSVFFDNTPRSNTTQYKAHSQHAHTCIICKTKDIPCIILQNEKHLLDPNALTLKNQQLEQQNTFHLIKFISLNKEQKKQLFLSTYNKAFDRLQKNFEHQSNSTSNKQIQQETHQNKEPNSKTSKHKEKDDDHNLKSLSSHYFKDSFNTFPAPEDTLRKAWTFPGLETESFNPNQPNTATFSKPTPITQLKELATRTAKKFAEENQVTETTKRHTHYFYCYLKAYLKAAANNDGIKKMDCDKALQHVINSDTNSHTLARIITFYDIQSQFRISIKNIKEKYSTDYFPQAEEFIINYYKIAIPDANNNALFFLLGLLNQKLLMMKPFLLFNNSFCRDLEFPHGSKYRVCGHFYRRHTVCNAIMH